MSSTKTPSNMKSSVSLSQIKSGNTEGAPPKTDVPQTLLSQSDISSKRLHKAKNKWRQPGSRNRAAKVRVKLPSIESYQKELEFPAEGSGRVIVRLERLMGTDKIRITDSKYMSTLLERLEEEENAAWLKRTRERKIAEQNRFRQLAVEGFMEPTPDMEDLYNHPVFRVNRILNRLTKLDNELTPVKKLPPITPVEPFAGLQGPVQYDSQHQYLKDNVDSGLEEYEDEYDDEEESEQRDTNVRGGSSKETVDRRNKEFSGEDGDEIDVLMKTKSSRGLTRKYSAEIEGEKDEEWEGEDYYGGDLLDTSGSLSSAKLKYGIPLSENLEAKCRAYRSKLVDMVFDDKMAVAEVNNYVAQFRDLLIHIGQSRDGPEMREKIRRLRRQCIESCRHAVNLLLQQVRSDASEGLPVDFSPQLVLLFFCTQLLLRELRKCRRLVMTLPIDMTAYYAENRPGPSSLGGVLSQIILCRQLNPDFNQEELCSIDKDQVEVTTFLDEMQEFMPKENTQTLALAGEDVFSKWTRRRRKKSMYRNFGSLCCVSKSGRFTV